MAKSECTNILNLIPLYIDNMLSDEENDIVCEHIKECASCRGEYEFLKSIMAGAESLPEIEVPKDFHETLMNKVRAKAKNCTGTNFRAGVLLPELPRLPRWLPFQSYRTSILRGTEIL